MERRTLLASDVDNTLLGDDASLEECAAWLNEVRDDLVLAYSSGRLYESVLGSIQSSALPEPDVIVGGVGTDIHFGAEAEPYAGWHVRLARSWIPATVREVMAQFDRVEAQPEEFNSDYKISYYLHDVQDEELANINQALRNAGIDAKIVYSSQRDLDILPARADKGAAVGFLAERWLIPAHRVIVCGDSANDRSMFTHSIAGHLPRGIIVGNAHDELKALQGKHVYHSPHDFAAGVLDGVKHWLLGAACS